MQLTLCFSIFVGTIQLDVLTETHQHSAGVLLHRLLRFSRWRACVDPAPLPRSPATFIPSLQHNTSGRMRVVHHHANATAARFKKAVRATITLGVRDGEMPPSCY